MSVKQQELEKSWQQYKQQQRKRSLYYALLTVLSVVAFLAIWEAVVRFPLVNVRHLPAPTVIFQTFIEKLNSTVPDGNTLGQNVIASLQVSLTGFFFAVLIGVPLGLLMGWFEPFDSFVRPLFELLRPVPPIAWIPVVVVFLGIGLKAKATIIFLTVFVSCVINSYAGIKLTSRTHINLMKTFGAGTWETFFKVGVPSAMPMVFTGLRVSIGSAWSTLVAAEMLAAKAGLGYMLQVGRGVGDARIVVLAMVTIAALGATLSALLNTLEAHTLKWKEMR